jgi:hypothetical protein
MSAWRTLGWTAFLLCSPAVLAQSIISARAGLVHYSDGLVLLNEKRIVPKPGQFTEVSEQEYLRTERGRAEVLLTPGVFLRLAEDSQIQMLSTRLEDVRVRLAEGSAVVEAAEINKETSVTLEIGATRVRLIRNGLYRLDAGEEARLRVFSGEAIVTAAGREYRLKGKREIELANDFQMQKFDPDDTDPLDRWSKRRATYLAMANLSASRLAYSRGYSLSGSRWIWNPYFSMITFLPSRNVIWSPYGFGYYSPAAAYAVYQRPAPRAPVQAQTAGFNRAGGYRTVPQTSAGTSGVVASSAASAGAGGGGGAVVSRGGSGTRAGGGARR